MSSQPAPSVDEIREQLLTEARKLAASARSVAWWRGVLLWLTAVVCAVAVLSMVDFLLRREEVGLRVLSLLALLTVAVIAAMRFVLPSWRFAPTSVQLARWIERKRPDLGERLSTAVEIAETGPDDTRYGSRGFRDAVLRAWMAEVDKPSWRSYLDRSRLWRALGMLAVVAGFFGFGFISKPVESKLALKRLFAPWSSDAWPRRDQLEFVDLPSVVAIGSELQLEIVDRNLPLPDPILVRVRAAEGATKVTEVPATSLENLAVVSLPPVERALDVRAVGGDDQSMPWHRIQVVAPPRLIEHRFEIEPPDYAHRKPVEIVGNRIQVLADSRVKFYGRLNEPVEDVSLLMTSPMPPEELGESEDVGVDAESSTWNVELADDRQTIVIGGSAGSKLKHSLTWKFEWTTAGGLRIEHPQPWSVEVVGDSPPRISLETLAMNQVAGNAALQLKGTAADDLGLVAASAWIAVEGEPQDASLSVPIWTSDGEELLELPIDRLWEFASDFVANGKPLVEGQVLSVWLEARDSLGQVSKSQVERLEVQSAENILAEILKRQGKLLARIRELVDAQRRNQQLTAEATGRIPQTDKIQRQDLDAFMGVAEMQRAIGGALSGTRDSIADEVGELERQLELNRLAATPVAEQIRFLAGEIESIASGVMRSAVESTSQAQSSVQGKFQSSSAAGSETMEQLDASVQNQRAALEALQALADRVDRDGALQQIQQDFSALAAEQAVLRADTDALQLQSLSGASPEDLKTNQAAVSAEQLALAQRLDGLLARSRELAALGKDENPALVQQLEEVADALTEGQASQLMRQATEEIDSRRFGAASETQKDVSEILDKALKQITTQSAGSSSARLEGKAEDLRQAAQDLAAIADAQTQLAEQMSDAKSNSVAADLAQQQASLRDETERRAEQSEKQGDVQTSRDVQNAANEQARAGEAAQSGKMQEAADSANAAAKQLENAAEKLEQRASEIERQAQQQQLFQLADSLTHLVDQQTPVAQGLEDLAQSAGRDATFETQARKLAAEQEAVRQVLRDVRNQAETLPTFDWALEQIESEMSRSVAAAQRFRIDPEARLAAQEALNKLVLVRQSLESNPASTPPSNGDDEPSSEEGQQPQMMLPPVASLKLIRGLQNEINLETQRLENEADTGPRNRRLAELSQQQKFLGEQLGKLLEEIQTAKDSNNENPL